MAATSSHPLRTPQPERREQLTRHLIAAIEPLLDGERSYSELSVETIIQAGGIARRTFYAYYRDKGDLLRAMTKDVTAQIQQGGTAWWELRGDISREQLRDGIRPAVENYLAHKVLLRAIAETSAYDANVRAAYGELMSHSIGELAKLIGERQRMRQLSRRVDALRTASWLIWMFERGLYELVGRAIDGGEVDAWLDSVTNIVWSTLYAPEA